MCVCVCASGTPASSTGNHGPKLALHGSMAPNLGTIPCAAGACFLQTHVSFACQPTPWKPEGRSVIATETSSFARPGKLCKSMSLNLAPQLLSNDFLVERSFKGPGILDGPAKRVIVLCFLSRPNVAGSLLCLFHSGHPYGATSASCRSRATPSPFRTKSSCIHRRPLAT